MVLEIMFLQRIKSALHHRNYHVIVDGKFCSLYQDESGNLPCQDWLLFCLETIIKTENGKCVKKHSSCVNSINRQVQECF